MPNNETPLTENILNEIAAIMRRVSKREEIEEEISGNICLSEVVNELIKVDGPVKDAAAKAIADYIKEMEIDSDSDIAQEITEAIDVKKFMPSLLGNKDFQNTITEAIESLIENGDLDLSAQITECLDANEIGKIMDSDTMRKSLGEKIKEYIDGLDLAELDAFNETFDEVAFTPERIEECLKTNVEEINEKIMEGVQSYLENMDENGEDSPIATAISTSKIFKSTLDKAIDELIVSGKISRLVEKVASDMLTNDNSDFRSQLTNAISQQMVSKIASSVVDRIFTR